MPLGIYCLINLFVFSIAPFCHAAYASAKNIFVFSFEAIISCLQYSEPLSVVIVFTSLRYGNNILITASATPSAFFPLGNLRIIIKLVLRSHSVTMALFCCFPTMRSISQSPKRVPFASAGRSWMLNLLGIVRTFVFRGLLICRLYLSLWRQCFLSSPLSSARICLYIVS